MEFIFTVAGLVAYVLRFQVLGLRVSGCWGFRVDGMSFLVAEWIHFTLFWDNTTHYKTKSVYV